MPTMAIILAQYWSAVATDTFQRFLFCSLLGGFSRTTFSRKITTHPTEQMARGLCCPCIRSLSSNR